MAYADDFLNPGQYGKPQHADHSEIEAILTRLTNLQDPQGCKTTKSDLSFSNWKAGHVEFAKRLARISAEQARRTEKLRIRHRRVSLARRVALITMVLAINIPVFL